MTEGSKPHPDRLRKKAEERLNKQPSPLQEHDPDKLAHELSVQEIELEMQNEQLRQSERQLEAAREKYFDLYDLAPVAYLTFNKKGLVTEANLAVCSLLGVDLSHLIKQSFAVFVDPLSQNAFYLHRHEVLMTGEKRTCELLLKGKDGVRFPAELQSVAVLSGEHPVMHTMLTDITERKEAEQLLRRMGAYNRSLLETTLDPLVTIDLAGKITDVNAATERVTGYSRETLIGTDFSNYFIEPDRAKAGYAHVIAEGLVRDLRLEIRHRDGHTTPVLYNASVYRDEAGNVLGIFAAARDITEQLRLEGELRQAHKLEAMGTLAGGIAHDFNNILAAIIGFTEMVLDDVEDNPHVHHKMEQVLKAGLRGRDLVRQILAFTRRAEGKRKEVSLTSLVKETQGLLRASLPRTININLAVTTGDDYIIGDSTQLQQVLVNLATNAADAMQKDGGQLTVDISSTAFPPGSHLPDPDMKPGTYARLTVKDTGTGMTEEVRQRIFEPFFTTKEPGKGTGMGLAVVYGIVKAHGGGVTVRSEVGQGSTFEVFLPQAQTPEAEREEAVTLLPTGTERILFIDDEESLVEMARGMLEGLGYRVTVAKHGSEAWNLFLEDPFRFDLVITDQTMPDITGVTLAQKMLRKRKGLPVILCTGYSEMVFAEKAQEIGIRAFAMKPLMRKELAETVRRVLDSSKTKV